MADIHQRMPVILSASHYDTWLDTVDDAAKLQELFRPYPPELFIDGLSELTAYPISDVVNNPRHEENGLCCAD